MLDRTHYTSSATAVASQSIEFSELPQEGKPFAYRPSCGGARFLTGRVQSCEEIRPKLWHFRCGKGDKATTGYILSYE